MGHICRILVPLCLLATAVSTLRVYPHQLAYFNEFAGGPENGYKHLLHSNLNWGQDLGLLRDWMKLHNIAPAEVGFYMQFQSSMRIYCGVSPSQGRHPGKEWQVWSVSARDVSLLDLKSLDAQPRRRIARIGYGMWGVGVGVCSTDRNHQLPEDN